MVRRLGFLGVVISLLSACSSLPPACSEIRSDRWPVQPNWLLRQIDPASLKSDTPARVALLDRFVEGDQIWTYRAPDRMQNPAMIDRAATGSSADGKYAYGRPASLHRGYVLLRDCEAIFIVPSNP